MQRRTRRVQKGNKKRRVNHRSGDDTPSLKFNSAIPRQVGLANPIQTRRRLSFQISANLAAASPSAAVRFHTNCPNEFTPGGVDSPPGLTVLLLQYNFYRVLGYRLRLEVINNTAVNATMYFVNQVTDPGATPSGYQQLAHNRHGGYFVIGPITSGAGHHVINRRYSIPQITGSNACLTADTYRGSAGTIPLDQTWFGFAAFNNSLAVNVDVFYMLTIEIDVVFYDTIPQLA